MAPPKPTPLLHVLFKGQILQSHKIQGGKATIGRLTDNDIVIDNMGVSRHHAHIIKEGDAYVIEDLGSANGFRVNGVKVKRSPLRPGDEIELGKHKLVFQMSAKGVAGFFREGQEEDEAARWSGGDTVFTGLPSQAPPPELSPGSPPESSLTASPVAPPSAPAAPPSQGQAPLAPAAPAASPEHLAPAPRTTSSAAPPAGLGLDKSAVDTFLRELDNCEYGIKVSFNDTITSIVGLRKGVTCIGRLKENDIVIDNLGVSRLHAKIIHTDGGAYTIEDQGSANGFKINGVLVRRSALYPGDEIIIGKHSMVFQYAAVLRGDLMGEPVRVPAPSTPWRTGTIAMGESPPPPPVLSHEDDDLLPDADVAPPPPPRNVQGGEPALDDITLVGGPPPAAVADEAGSYIVTVMKESDQVGRFMLTKKVTCIGRLMENDIVLDDEQVSRLHATLVVEEGRLKAEDQDSANGIRVHGLKLKSSPLYAGDAVEIGPFTLKISHGEAPDARDAIQQGVTSEPEDMGSTQVMSRDDIRRRQEEWAARAARERAIQAAAEATAQPDAASTTPPRSPSAYRRLRTNEEQIDTEPLGLPRITEAELAAAQRGESAPADSTPPTSSAPTTATSVIALEVVSADGRHVALTAGPYAVGSGKSAEVPCTGLLVRREHATIRRTFDGGYQLEAMAKFPRVRVNGATIARIKLAPGDVITIGKNRWDVRVAE